MTLFWLKFFGSPQRLWLPQELIEAKVEVVALIASIVSICLAFFAIWQANHNRDQSDKLNRDTTEKLARIEAFATSIKEDAFGEIKRYGDFWRAGGKVSEEAEKAKEEELKKLKHEREATTSAEINKVLQIVESRLGSSTETSTISDIKKEFEELKKEIGKIQEKSFGEVQTLETKEKFKLFWLLVPEREAKLLATAAKHPVISKDDLEKAGVSNERQLITFVQYLHKLDVIDDVMVRKRGLRYEIKLTPEFREFLETVK